MPRPCPAGVWVRLCQYQGPRPVPPGPATRGRRQGRPVVDGDSIRSILRARYTREMGHAADATASWSQPGRGFESRSGYMRPGGHKGHEAPSPRLQSRLRLRVQQSAVPSPSRQRVGRSSYCPSGCCRWRRCNALLVSRCMHAEVASAHPPESIARRFQVPGLLGPLGQTRRFSRPAR